MSRLTLYSNEPDVVYSFNLTEDIDKGDLHIIIMFIFIDLPMKTVHMDSDKN